jgi:hypothetical protein
MTLLGKREFFRPEIPFLLGRFPDRPAPTHVINGLLADAFGIGPAADLVRELIRGDQVRDFIPGLDPRTRNDASAFEALRDTVRVIFDPDAKVFPSRGSPFPLHLGAISRDPSDDGMGSLAWALIQSTRSDATELLGEFFATPAADDGVTAFADVLCERYRPSGQPGASRATGSMKLSGALGTRYSRALSDLALRPIDHPQHFTRSLKTAAFTRGVFAAVFLATLRAAEIVEIKPKSWAELSPLFVLGSVPPGAPDSAEVRLATRSYEHLMVAHRKALAERLHAKLPSRRLNVPQNQYAEVLLSSTFQLDRTTLRDATEIVHRSQNTMEITRRLIHEIYPAGHLERGFRSMGAKIGMAGPDRGNGAPRLLFETPILALFVDAALGEDDRLQYEDWLDKLFEQFGFICGRGRKHDYEQLLSPLGSQGPLSRALDSNHEALRRRMIRAGLAIEYSDAETEVMRTTA